MHSQPSPGDGLPRLIQSMRAELKRLAARDAALAKRIAELEARVTELEGA